MWNKLKSTIEFVLSFVFSYLAEVMNKIDVEWLKKVFYLLSIILLLMAMRKMKKDGKMGPEKLVSAPSVVDQSLNPKNKAKMVNGLLKKIKLGGSKMLERIKTFGVTRLVTIVLEVVFFALAVLSAFVPELNWIQENLIILFGAMGLTGIAGAWAKGKELGEKAKQRIETKKRLADIKLENKKLNSELKQLDLDYGYLNPFIERITLYGGELSPEHHAAKDTYDKQRHAILNKLTANKKETASLLESLKTEELQDVSEIE